VVSSLRFFFGVTLGRKDVPERIAYARGPKRFLWCEPGGEAVPNRRDRVASQLPMRPACVPARSWGYAFRTLTAPVWSSGPAQRVRTKRGWRRPKARITEMERPAGEVDGAGWGWPLEAPGYYASRGRVENTAHSVHLPDLPSPKI
jgi:hypothetical protein